MRCRPGDHRGPGQQGPTEPFAGAQPARNSRGVARGVVRARGSGAGPGRSRRSPSIPRRSGRGASPAGGRHPGRYDKVLRQRTALLKSASGSRFRGDRGALETLDVWDGHLVHGAELMAARMTLVNELAPEVQKSYQLLAPASRPASIAYHASVEVEPDRPDVELLRTALLEKMAARRDAELERGVCFVGPHRDDLELGSVTNWPKALPATGNHGRWRWHCDWRPMSCCAPTGGDQVLLLDGVCSTNWTPRAGQPWPLRRPRRSRCW